MMVPLPYFCHLVDLDSFTLRQPSGWNCILKGLGEGFFSFLIVFTCVMCVYTHTHIFYDFKVCPLVCKSTAWAVGLLLTIIKQISVFVNPKSHHPEPSWETETCALRGGRGARERSRWCVSWNECPSQEMAPLLSLRLTGPSVLQEVWRWPRCSSSST